MTKRAIVASMFDRIAPRYDLANNVMTAGRDGVWRKAAIEALDPRPGQRILDVGCGTGKMMKEMLARAPCRPVGADLAPAMLRRCRTAVPRVPVLLANGERLPFRDATFDGATNAFVLRNLESLPAFFTEMRRVLKPGGRLVSLEIAKPRGAIYGPFHGLYFGRVVPVLGGIVTGQPDAYRYLAGSVEGFPEPETLLAMMETAGFRADAKPLQRGAVAVYRADVR